MVFIDRLGLLVLLQKSVLKNVHWDPKYNQKSVENQPSKPNQQNSTHFSQYRGTRCMFFKTDFCVETVSPSWSIYIEIPKHTNISIILQISMQQKFWSLWNLEYRAISIRAGLKKKIMKFSIKGLEPPTWSKNALNHLKWILKSTCFFQFYETPCTPLGIPTR